MGRRKWRLEECGRVGDATSLLMRWIVAFLVIFLLCMVFVFSMLKKPTAPSERALGTAR
ncbi:MAG: hypothetical protein OWT28_08755 [Firmicutes bacterium]|nr:hypothetical protein [Bacillota bacterium]